MLSQLWNVHSLFLPIELDTFISLLLFICLSHAFEEWMLKAIIKRNSEVRVKDKNFVKKINSFFSCTWINST